MCSPLLTAPCSRRNSDGEIRRCRNSHVESVPDHSSAGEEFGADALRNAWKKSVDIASGARSALSPSYPAPR